MVSVPRRLQSFTTTSCILQNFASLRLIDSNVFKYFRIRQTHLSEHRDWQGRPESNRRSWIWSPGHNHHATPLWLGWPDSNRQLSH